MPTKPNKQQKDLKRRKKVDLISRQFKSPFKLYESKESLDDIIREIDKIKQKIIRSKPTSLNQTRKKNINNNINKSISSYDSKVNLNPNEINKSSKKLSMSHQRYQTQTPEDNYSPYKKIVKQIHDYDSQWGPHNQINVIIKTNNKKQSEWNKVKMEIKRLEEINNNLISQNNILKDKLLSESKQKSHLQSVLKNSKFQIQSEFLKTNKQISIKQSPLNASIRTKKKIICLSSVPVKKKGTISNDSAQSNQKIIQLLDFDSVRLQNPQSIKKNSKNVITQKQQIDERQFEVKKLEEEFNLLLGISRTQKKKETKIKIKKQLYQIANRIQTLKKKQQNH